MKICNSIIYIIATLVTFMSTAHPIDELSVIKKHIEHERYFSALYSSMGAKVLIPEDSEVDSVSPIFYTYLKNLGIYKNLSSPLIRSAEDYAKSGNYSEAIKVLGRIERGQSYYTESLALTAMYYQIQKKFTQAEQAYVSAIISLEEKRVNWHQTKDYVSVLSDKLKHNLGRLHFEMKNFDKAQQMMESIPKNQFIWPTTLIDLAWIEYTRKNYGRALGILSTYKSPMLKRYVYPEVDYLIALIYYELCYFELSDRAVDSFEKEFLNLSVIIDENLKKDIDYTTILDPEKEISDSVMAKVDLVLAKNNKTMKYFSYRNSVSLLNKEILNAEGNQRAIERFKYWKEMLRVDMNLYLKDQLIAFVQEVQKIQAEIVRFKLALSIKKRETIIDPSIVSSEEVLLKELSEIDGKDTKAVWVFKGAYWVDELGDNNFALNSKCK